MQGELGIQQRPQYRERADRSVVATPALDESTRSFVRRILEAGLAQIDDLKKVVVSLMAESSHFTPERLAAGLVAAGILTQWQSTKLLAGKSRGFYLGSYRLLRPLGKGGMGVVYLGEHQVMKRLMALKILPPEATRDPRRIERFKEEARACAQLDHPNIVRAYDFAEGGTKLYIVMEYVDGIDLQHAVQRDGVMSISDVMDVLVQATAGLAHAHERGIIHRDIKPSNLLLRTDGVVKVSDLGLARIGWTGEEDSGKRRLMGTVDFVAPEQAINSKTVDARADIYSLACTLYYLLAGRPPFTGDTVAKRLARHQTAPVPDIRLLRKDCPASIAELTTRMMAKRPDDRPKSAVELLSQLKRLGGIGHESPPPRLKYVAPAGDTAVDDAVFQATMNDSSLSGDGEVVVVPEGEFDFGSLPPVDLSKAVVPSPPVLPSQPSSARKKSKRSVSRPTIDGAEPRPEGGNQQLLLGIGLAVAVMALLAVVGLGVVSFSRPLPQTSPKIKSMEGGKDGKSIVIIRESLT